MKENLDIFLQSDLLERYLLGDTDTLETQKAESYIEKYPEVNKRYVAMQEDLERYARAHAVKAPAHIREVVIDEVRSSRAVTKRYPSWFTIVASAAAVLFAASTFYFYQEGRLLKAENTDAMKEIASLQNELSSSGTLLASAYEELSRLRNPETQKYVLRGNQRAKNLKTVAYVNPIEKISLINVVDLPNLPEDQVFQMWADIDGKMVSLGVLEKAENKLLRIPYNENATSYNITIERKGGNNHATVENLVANVEFQ
ncbi:anti-sigma factor domain-containing protein [Sungkyunkwania multivorans]|uniref:Anti-sigma factor domain-containing protein n=1 Tax=Sungkyunkwania multivorans TaxID=1173618 RepID=A0ABW3CXV9_9FLAO